MALKSFKKLIADAKQTDSYWIEAAKLDFAIMIEAAINESGMNKKEFAERIGKSAAFVSKILRGDNNFQIDTMVVIARRLGFDLAIKFERKPSSWWGEFGQKSLKKQHELPAFPVFPNKKAQLFVVKNNNGNNGALNAAA